MRKLPWLAALAAVLISCGKQDETPANHTTGTNNQTSNNTSGTNNTFANNTTAQTNNTTAPTNSNTVVDDTDCILTERDFGGDGTINRRELIQIGENALVIMEREDTDGDGVWDLQTDTTHDDQGRVVIEKIDFDMDGAIDLAIEQDWDAESRRTGLRLDYDFDGTYEVVYIAQYAADGGERFTRDGAVRANMVVPADGAIDFEAVVTVDANGNRVRVTRDIGADGSFEYVATHTYDANGKETRMERDGVVVTSAPWAEHVAEDPADGVADEVRVTIRDAAGVEIGAEFDGYLGSAGWVKADGVPDRVTRNVTYDAQGNVVSYEEDGYVHPNGQLVSTADGLFSRNTAEYDASGNLTRVEFDQENDGVADFIATYTTNATGQLTEATFDGIWRNDGTIIAVQDGTIDTIARLEWSGENLVSERIDVDNDGTDDAILLQEWDANGRLTRSTRDGIVEGRELRLRADGVLDIVVENVWYDDGQLRSRRSQNQGSVAMSDSTRGACSMFE